MNQKTYKNALPNEYELHWYKIEQVLGQGAFGMTYLAYDKNLDRNVAIKEYLPSQLSHRNADLTIQPTSTDNKDDFEWGLKRFISEARTLTKFVHPNLVSVFNVFEMNNTAYMVMNYEIGKDLQGILKSRKTLREDELMKILIPLLSGLEVMHEKGFVHRDIKPGNIFIRKDGSPVLLDFGSARQTRNLREDGTTDPQTLTNFVSPGYAPIEQYTGKSDRQGPWTDIYGMGATLYKAVTGEMPIASIDRSETLVHDGKDAYISIKKMAVGEYSDKFLTAIDHALQFKTQDRPQTVTEWQKEFGISQDDIETVPVPENTIAKEGEAPTVKVEQEVETVQLSQNNEQPTKKIEMKDQASQDSGKETKTSIFEYLKYIMGGALVGLIIIVVLIVNLLPEDKSQLNIEEETTVYTEPSENILEKETEIINEIVQEDTASEEVTQQENLEEETSILDDQQKIKELLILAEKDLKELRLTSPKDNNAFDKYLAVLKLDENNEEAKLGIQSISDRYISLAYRAMNKNELDVAKKYLKKAANIQPDSEKLTKAQQELQARYKNEGKAVAESKTDETVEVETVAESDASTETSEEDSESVWGDVKDWFKETAEKGEAVNKEDTTSDKVRKTLGGN